ncbi:MAG: hypothetical protein ACP5PV_09465 [Methanothrix sp.]
MVRKDTIKFITHAFQLIQVGRKRSDKQVRPSIADKDDPKNFKIKRRLSVYETGDTIVISTAEMLGNIKGFSEGFSAIASGLSSNRIESKISPELAGTLKTPSVVADIAGALKTPSVAADIAGALKTPSMAADIAGALKDANTRTVDIEIHLPPGVVEYPRRRLKVLGDATIGELADQLAERFDVEKGQWKLYRRTNEGSELLKRGDKIKNHSIDGTQLYFYPNF